MRDADGNVLHSSSELEFVGDPKDAQRPELRQREKSRRRGLDFWPVLTDQKKSMLDAAINGDIPPARTLAMTWTRSSRPSTPLSSSDAGLRVP